MRLILIRHAETDGNKRSFVGRQDLPLNANGHAQALELARALAPLSIDIVLASPLRRAVQTAGPIASATHPNPVIPAMAEAMEPTLNVVSTRPIKCSGVTS